MERQNIFSSRLGFILATMGAAVGLGSMWRFPYEAGKHGGGAFVLIYMAFLLLLGWPLVVVEIALGRSRNGGTYEAFWNTGPWHAVGWAAALTPTALASFYNMIIGWLVGYVVLLLRGQLLQVADFATFFAHFQTQLPLQMAYTSGTTLLVAWIVNAGVNRGIERFSKTLMPAFVAMLVLLIGYSLTLDHAMEGVKFYLIPRWHALTPQAVYTALSLALFSLSIGLGALMTYGAYLPKQVNIPQSALAIVLGALSIAFLAGLLIFPLITHEGIGPTAGPPLVFISLPYVFQQLGPVLGAVVGVMFLLLLIFAALTTSISLMEVGVNHTIELSGLPRRTAVRIVTSIILCASIPSLLAKAGVARYAYFWHHQETYKDFMDALATVVDIAILGGTFWLCLFLKRHWATYALEDELSTSILRPWMLTYVRWTVHYVAPWIVGAVLVGTSLGYFS